MELPGKAEAMMRKAAYLLVLVATSAVAAMRIGAPTAAAQRSPNRLTAAATAADLDAAPARREP
jgi:hypothetical protein